MTYCIGSLLDQGIIFASDSRTNAGMDNIAKFCKMTVFERRGDRVIVLLSSGNLAGTQAVIGVLNQRREPITYWITLDETATLPGLGRKIEQIRYGLKGQIPDGLLFRISSIGRNDEEGFNLQQEFLVSLVGHIDPAIRSRYVGV